MYSSGVGLAKTAIQQLALKHDRSHLNIDPGLYRFWIESLLRCVKRDSIKSATITWEKPGVRSSAGYQRHERSIRLASGSRPFWTPRKSGRHRGLRARVGADSHTIWSVEDFVEHSPGGLGGRLGQLAGRIAQPGGPGRAGRCPFRRTRPRSAPPDSDRCHFPACTWAAFWICSFTASRLKLAPFCIGGNSMAVWASFATSCWT